MLSSTTLELAIGMAFIYLLISLFCTAVNEIIAGVLSSRAKNLERGLRSLFTEGCLALRDNAGVIQLDANGKPRAGVSLTDAVYDHGLLQSLYKSGTGGGATQWWGGGKRLPSYIPSRTFVSVLVDLLFADAATPAAAAASTPAATLAAMLGQLNALPESKAKQALQAMVRQAGGDVGATRAALEHWFNDGMDRVSGWYKRRTQIVLFSLGLGLAFSLNIDSIHIARVLWTNPALRAYSISAAAQYSKANPLGSGNEAAVAGDVFAKLQSLALPMGWNGDGPLQWIQGQRLPHPGSAEVLLFAVGGWLLTAIAVTLGAPFWFDTLNRFMVVRSTVKPREKSEIEPSKA